MSGRWWWLVVVAALAYANTFTVPFIFDDNNAIVENPYIRQLWPPAYLVHAPHQSTVAGRPLVSLTLALNYAVSGLNPWSYHVVNLALHAACVLLLFGIARRTVGEWPALAIAAVWAVHPLLTESVTYVIQRTELLMALCLLLTLYCVGRGWRLGAVAACAAGMACKEVMVVAPVIVLLYDRTFLAGSFRDAWRQRSRLYVALAGTWIVLAASLLTGSRNESVGLTHADIRPLEYLLTQAGVLLHYLRLSVWPHALVLDYDDWPVGVNIPATLVIIGLLVATVWALRCRPKLGFLGAWFFLVLAPTSSVVPIITEIAAERRMYLPLIAVVAPVVAALGNAGRYVVPALVVVGGTLTFLRNADYRSEETIWRDTVHQRPGNVRALVNLATIVKPTEAIGLYERALQLAPGSAEAHYNLAIILAGQNRLNDALPHFHRAAELSPRSSLAQYQYGLALANARQWPAAKAAVQRALALEPGNSKAQQLLHALERQQ